jgi:heme-degrading monooxygenase HmoA
MAARMMVFAQIKPGEEEAFEAAFEEVTRKVKGTAGHVKDELLRDVTEPGKEGEPSKYILLSEWESVEAFLAWEDAPIHRQTTTPMRPHWAGAIDRRMYEVAFRLAD